MGRFLGVCRDGSRSEREVSKSTSGPAFCKIDGLSLVVGITNCML
jgi:hypothetical protein